MQQPARLRSCVTSIFLPLIVANLAAWAWAFAVFHGDTMLLGAAFLAYCLGLRHAVDADHIAAIDNATRRLMIKGQKPIATGLYFSLGHSTVVWLASIGIAFAAASLDSRMKLIEAAGGVIGTWVSVIFLFGIAGANLVVLRGLFRAVRRHRKGEPYDENELGRLLEQRGVYSRLLRPVFRLMSKCRHMYAVGFLFGLGFDTATEIGVLGISAAAAVHGLPIWSILVFPALFTAGMSLIDTLDSTLMVGAYGWAFVDPGRKLYYNLTLTFFSVVIALAVGAIETSDFLAHSFTLNGPLSQLISGMNGKFGALGYVIIALFSAIWLASVLAIRFRQARGQKNSKAYNRI